MKIPVKSLYKLYSSAIRHPQYRWLIIFGTLIYFFSPIDLSPDLFPIVGQLDDVVVLGLFFTEIIKVVMEFFQMGPIPVEEVQPMEQDDRTVQTVDVKAVSCDDET